MSRVSIPGVGEFDRMTVLAPWGGEEFVRYLPVRTASTKATRQVCGTHGCQSRKS
jgi:hypothetical protein